MKRLTQALAEPLLPRTTRAACLAVATAFPWLAGSLPGQALPSGPNQPQQPTSAPSARPKPPTAARPPAAQLMMGGDPRNSYAPGTNALAPRGGLLDGFSLPAPPSDEPVELDPVCEKIKPANPRFAPGNPSPGTRKMAQLLAGFREQLHPGAAAYLSDKMAAMLHGRLTNSSQLNERFRLQFMLAVQQINSARPDSALNTLSSMERLVAQSGGQLDRRSKAEVRMRKGMAFLRLGEQENCLASHNEESCLFPLTPKAYHILPRGSQGAVATFSSLLADHPDDLSARWLLNLAHMTLGEYPGKVNPRFLIPPEKFASEHPMDRFLDVGDGLGVDANDLAGGCVVDDFDNDGFYDLVISAWDLTGQLRFFRNKGDGTFVDRTSEAGLVGLVGSLNIQQTDYDNDGHLDIWALRGAWLGPAGRVPNSLIRNNGDGTFSDVTEGAGLLSFHPTQASRWFDFDGDGWLDVFIANETVDPGDPDWCELYRNNRNGTFTECAKACGIQVAEFIKGVACGDYDNDGRPDLYLAVRSPDTRILLHNDGPDSSGQWRFSNTAAKAGITEQQLPFATFFFDYDNDGWQDLLSCGYFLPNGVGDVAADYLGLPHQGSKAILYRNKGDGTFDNVSVQTKLNRVCHTMGHNYGDIDNDGWLDFYLGTGDPDFRTLIPNRMFRNASGRFFQDVTTATGTGHLQKGHGTALADFDDDGDQDIYSSMGGAYSGDFARNVLFMNPGSSNGWLKLKLVGVKANRAAIGARIKLVAQTPSGPREIHRVVSSGGNFGSNPLRQEIGLGDATAVKSVEILWPGSGTRESLTGLELNRSYQITEGTGIAAHLKLNPVKLNRGGNTHKMHALQ